jgi:hypothetical protein
MLKRLIIWVLAVAAPLTAGCLQKETSHTLYLAPDGSVSWMASEANVYSDETEFAKRIVEEQTYLGAALLGTHGVARGLAALDPVSPVRTTVVRDERPYLVLTSARFASIDRVLTQVFTEIGIRSSPSVVREVNETALRVRLDFSQPLDEGETPVSQLADKIEHLRIVLTEGRFSAVTGFDVTDGMSATLSNEWLERAEKAYEAKSAIEFALTWSLQ